MGFIIWHGFLRLVHFSSWLCLVVEFSLNISIEVWYYWIWIFRVNFWFKIYFFETFFIWTLNFLENASFHTTPIHFNRAFFHCAFLQIFNWITIVPIRIQLQTFFVIIIRSSFHHRLRSLYQNGGPLCDSISTMRIMLNYNFCLPHSGRWFSS